MSQVIFNDERMYRFQFLNRTDIDTLVLGENVLHIEPFSFFGSENNIQTIYCYSTNPPSITENWVDETGQAIVYVYSNSLDKYQNHNFWKMMRLNTIDVTNPEIPEVPEDEPIVDENEPEIIPPTIEEETQPVPDPEPEEEPEVDETVEEVDTPVIEEQPVVIPDVSGTVDPNVIFKYTETSLGVIITGASGYSTELIIPNTINGKPVLSINAPYAFRYSSIEKLVIPDTVTSIKKYSFRDADKLTELKLPSNLTELGAGCFANTEITSIRIPGTCEIIEKSAFAECSELTNLIIEEGVKEIGDTAFTTCSKLTSIKLPNSLQKIGVSTFRNCPFTEIIIPDNVTYIGDDAFNGEMNPKLVKVILGKSVNYIGSHAFLYQDKLRQVYMYGPKPKDIFSWSFPQKQATLYIQQKYAEQYSSSITIPMMFNDIRYIQ